MLIGACIIDDGLYNIVHMIKDGFFPLFYIAIPILLIIMGVIDLGKIVITNDEKEMKTSSGRLVKRIMFTIACFLVVTLVNIMTDLLVNTEDDNVYSDDQCTWQDYWYS